MLFDRESYSHFFMGNGKLGRAWLFFAECFLSDLSPLVYFFLKPIDHTKGPKRTLATVRQLFLGNGKQKH